MARQKWMPIDGCSNYRIGSNGEIKRLRHRANGTKHKFLPEKIMKASTYVYLTDDNGTERHLSVQRLFVTAFLDKGKVYYKTDHRLHVNRLDSYIEKSLYERLSEKPQIFKIVKT